MQSLTSQILAPDDDRHAESAARQQIEAKATADMMALVHSAFNWALVEPEMIDAYQKVFTEEEVTAMITFYSTPAGQATITKIPQAMQAVMASSMTRLQALDLRMRAIGDKARADADAADAPH